MSELRKFVAPEILFGTGAMELLAPYARNFGARRILVVADQGVRDAGWVRQVTDILDDEGLEYVLFTDVSPNPRDHEVMAGAELFAQERCDIVVAVGGGSPMDCAKGISVVHANGRHVLEFEGIDQVPVPGSPLICIPTTAGTSADVSQFAIIADTTEKVKIAIISKSMVPDVSLIDPVTTTTMDPYLTACTGVDALVHAIEAFVSTANSPLLDLHALEAIRLITGNLEAVLSDPLNIELRDRLMRGSLEAGLAFSNASLGAVHAMAHSLGGFLDLPHGECNSLLLDHVVAFNYAASDDRYRAVGEAMGLDLRGCTAKDSSAKILGEVRRLREAVGIPSGLAGRGVKAADIPVLARKAVKDPCMVTNPRAADQRDIEVVYEEAL